MTAQQFQCLGDFFRKNSFRRSFLFLISKVFPWINVAVYLALLVFLAITKNVQLWHCLFVPAITFLVITVLRAGVNAPRPYDALDYTPFYPVRHGKGKSFPSRHAGSAMIIALTSFTFSIWLGIIMSILALCICFSRVATGAHYPKDVIAGIFISLVFAGLGFFLF